MLINKHSTPRHTNDFKSPAYDGGDERIFSAEALQPPGGCNQVAREQGGVERSGSQSKPANQNMIFRVALTFFFMTRGPEVRTDISPS